jgi:precorrin-6B methylase 2
MKGEMMTKDWSVGELLELSGGYWQTCVLHAGVQLDLFTALGEEALSSREVASRIGSDLRATEMLLNALVAMGLLNKTGDRFGNGTSASVYLRRDSESYQGHIINHHHHLMESWAHLESAVRDGAPLAPSPAFSDEKRRESFLMGMFNLASELAPVLVPKIELAGRKRLLDLGGGPGTYAIHFCLRNPGLEAAVLDLPGTRPFAEKTIGAFGLSDRIAFVEGDFLKDEIHGSYDVAWLSHILHGEGPQECELILEKVAASLDPGGTIFVHEFILNDDMAGPLFPALFSLNMLLATESGQSYSQGQITSMLQKAGARDIRRLELDLSGPSGVIAGRV